MSVTLPGYDPLARCEKCCHNDVSTHYHGGRRLFSTYSCPLVEQMNTSYPPEHLCRRCQRCHYTWAEALALTGAEVIG